MKYSKIRIGILVPILLLTSFSPAAAHVVVKPAEAGVGAFQTFTTGVPVEKDKPTTALRIVIPEGLNYVTPNVKPGWKIDVKKEGEGETAKTKEITWTQGSIPPGQRDEFSFSAQVPAKPTTLVWKAYQTYEDGTIVSWDQEPKEEKKDSDDDSKNNGPYSQTKIIDDLNKNTTNTSAPQSNNVIPYTALTLSAIALALTLRKQSKDK